MELSRELRRGLNDIKLLRGAIRTQVERMRPYKENLPICYELHKDLLQTLWTLYRHTQKRNELMRMLQ